MKEMTSAESPRTSRGFKLTSAVLAFVVLGSWAWYVNSRPSVEPRRATPLVSGLVQGAGSFTMTLIMVHSVTWLFRRMPANRLRMVLPALITVLVTGTCLVAAHCLAGTADIPRTVAPGLVIAFLFNIVTADQLRRSADRVGGRRDAAG